MERTRITLLVVGIASLILVGFGAIAYAQTTAPTSSTGQCGSMMSGTGGMGMMGGMNSGMMSQSGDRQAQCQGMMGQYDMGQCQGMVDSRNMEQCQTMIRQQNMTQTCH